MDAGISTATQAIIKKLQANFKARRAAAAACPLPSLLGHASCTHAPCATPATTAGGHHRCGARHHCRGGGALPEGGRRR